jgi:hypothetical protein
LADGAFDGVPADGPSMQRLQDAQSGTAFSVGGASGPEGCLLRIIRSCW